MRIYDSANFRIDSDISKSSVYLTQFIKHPVIHTAQLPATYTLLSKYLPSIFNNLCFNDKKLSFAEEVRDTEIGHLFEHLVLEYLKLEAVKRNIRATFDGETSWDWTRYGKGTFHIRFVFDSSYRKFFDKSVRKAAATLDLLYMTSVSPNLQNFSRNKTRLAMPILDKTRSALSN